MAKFMGKRESVLPVQIRIQIFVHIDLLQVARNKRIYLKSRKKIGERDSVDAENIVNNLLNWDRENGFILIFP